MVTSLSAIQLTCKLKASLSDTKQTFGVGATVDVAQSQTLSNGTTADEADRAIVNISRSILDTNNEDLDLFDLAGFDAATDLIGNTVTLAEIVGVLVANTSATTGGTLDVGGNGTAAAWVSAFKDSTDIIQLPPGAWMVLANTSEDPAYDVTDSTNHLLRFAAVGGDVTYDVAILGRSA